MTSSQTQKTRRHYDAVKKQIIKESGLKVANDAESRLEKHDHTEFVERTEKNTGKSVKMRKNIADIMELKGKVRRPRKVFTVPDLSGITFNSLD